MALAEPRCQERRSVRRGENIQTWLLSSTALARPAPLFSAQATHAPRRDLDVRAVSYPKSDL